MEKLYERFKGLTIVFPRKLYSKEYVREYIKENYGHIPTKDIARYLDITDRRVRQLAKEYRE